MNKLPAKRNLVILGVVLAGLVVAIVLIFINFPADEPFNPSARESPSSSDEEQAQESDNEQKPSYKPPYKYYFGEEMAIVYDSTQRGGVPPYYPLTAEFVTENTDKYLVDVVDVPECSGTTLQREFIFNYFHPQSLYDHGIIYVNQKLTNKLQEQYDNLPRETGCNYILKTAEARKKLPTVNLQVQLCG